MHLPAPPPSTLTTLPARLLAVLLRRPNRLLSSTLLFISLTTLITLLIYTFNYPLLSPLQPPPTAAPPHQTPHNAYIFYATNFDYACSTLVNIDRLLHHPTIKTHPNNRIGVYISTDLSHGTPSDRALSDHFDHLAQSTRGRVFVVRAEPPQDKLKNPMHHYKDVLLKLVPYDLGVRDISNTSATAPRWTLWGDTGEHKVDRMIILDSDQLILRNLDHLFSLPPVVIAAPRTYWGSGDRGVPFGSTTTLMVAQPSKSLWERVQQAMDTLREGEYDMDLIQRVFANEILTLPGRYCTLNSHWEVNDQPFWYHHARDSRIHLDEQLAYEDILGPTATPADGFPMMGTNYTQDDLAEKGDRRKWIDEDKGVGLLWDAEVVHFTALGKPWSFTVGDVRALRPEAHWVFAEMWGEWRATARKVCPGWREMYGSDESMRQSVVQGKKGN